MYQDIQPTEQVYDGGFGSANAEELSFVTYSGIDSVRIGSSDNRPMHSLTIYGNTEDGSGVGEWLADDLYEIPCTLSGKNLINPAAFVRNNGTKEGVSYASDGSVTFTNSSSNIYYFKVSSFIVPAGAYTLSADLKNHSSIVYLEYPNDNNMTSIRDNRRSVTKSFESPTRINLLVVIAANTTETLYIQLESSTTATDFEKYRTPDSFSLFCRSPLYTGDRLCIKPAIPKAVKNPGAEVVSGLQQWDSIPELQTGTNILTVNTTIPAMKTEAAVCS